MQYSPTIVTYMLRVLGTGADGLESLQSQVGIPRKVLGTVDAAPIPMSVHDPRDERGVVDVGDIIVGDLRVARRQGGRKMGSPQGKELGNLHVDGLLTMAGRMLGSKS